MCISISLLEDQIYRLQRFSVHLILNDVQPTLVLSWFVRIRYGSEVTELWIWHYTRAEVFIVIDGLCVF